MSKPCTAAPHVALKERKSLGNDPQLVRNVTLGQKVSVSVTEISDWMYLDNGKMIGNFTLRVLLKRMPKEQAEEMRTRFQMNE